MTNLEYIAANLSDEDILCQIAEEASELAQAALKLRRVITGTNPTPVPLLDAAYSVIEEYADIVGAMDVWSKKLVFVDNYNFDDAVADMITAKYERWAQRIKEAKENDLH